jgi:hypothetical protein
MHIIIASPVVFVQRRRGKEGTVKKFLQIFSGARKNGGAPRQSGKIFMNNSPLEQADPV